MRGEASARTVVEGEAQGRSRLTAGSVLARGALTNVTGQAIPLLVGLALTPMIVHRLGPDAFGVLSLGWTILSLSVVFNLGLGRATTKYAAEHLAAGTYARIPSLFWVSVVLNVILGLAGAALTATAAAYLVSSGILKVPAPLAGSAIRMFVALALALPFTFVSSTLRGMLEAGQHFDEVNLARVVFNGAIFVLPAVALVFGGGLVAIGVLLLLSRAGETLTFAWLCSRRYRPLPWAVGRAELRTLLVYGGWLTVTNALMPLLVNVDRLVIGSLLSVGAVAFYSVAADLVMRATVVPSSLTLPLFPAFSALAASGETARLKRLYMRSMKYAALVMAPLVAIVVVESRPFLQAWLGDAFAAGSTRVMQVLAVGLLVNSVAFLPYTLLQAVGRPDLTAKSHLAETPIALCAMVVLTLRYGIEGAAIATSFRLALDLAILAFATGQLGYLDASAFRDARAPQAVLLVAVLLVAAAGAAWIPNTLRQALVLVPVVLVWAVTAWRIGLDAAERGAFRSFAAHPIAFLAKSAGTSG